MLWKTDVFIERQEKTEKKKCGQKGKSHQQSTGENKVKKICEQKNVYS